MRQYFERLSHYVICLVHNLEVFIHIPKITSDEGFELYSEQGKRAFEFCLVLRLDLLSLTLFQNSINLRQWNSETSIEIIESLVAILQRFTIVINVTEIGIDNDALSIEHPMKPCKLQRVERNEVIRHYSTASIDRAMLSESLVFE